jgi:protein-S-isoprenylcysteine O-methyltransferase Ste14
MKGSDRTSQVSQFWPRETQVMEMQTIPDSKEPQRVSLLPIVLVALQFALATVIFLTPRISPVCMVCFGVAAIGAAVAVWAWITMGIFRLRVMPHPSGKVALLETGPYRWIRHPMYSGLAIASFGLVLTNPSPWRIICLLSLCVVLEWKSRYEERLLLAHFLDYAQYRTRTWRFVPGIY